MPNNEIKPHTQEEQDTPQKKGSPLKTGLITLASLVILSGGTFVAYKTIFPEQVEAPTEEVSKVDTKDLTKEQKDALKLIDVDTYKSIPDKVVDYTQAPFSDGYEKDDSRLTYLNSDKANELMESGRHIIYIGRPNCPYCHQFRPKLDVALEKSDTEIYSIDTIYGRYDTKLNDLLDVWGVSGVPEMVVIEDGKLVTTMYESFGEEEITSLGLINWLNENK